MGQWYSVYVEGVAIRNGCNFSQLLEAIRKTIEADNISTDCTQLILSSENERELIESIYGPYHAPHSSLDELDCEWGSNDEPNDWNANFHGSYGWEGFMYECFKAMAPYLATGCTLSVYPDEGGWHLEVQEDGSALETEEPEREIKFIVVDDDDYECLRDGWANPLLFNTEDDAQDYILDQGLVGRFHVEEYEVED